MGMTLKSDLMSPWTGGLPQRLTCSVGEAARLLGISRSTAYACARTGQLPVLRLGRRIVVPLAAIAELLQVESRR